MLNSKAVYMQMAVMSILTMMSADAAACNWCTAAPDLTACVTDPDDWTLVRAIGPTKVGWFDNVDSLQGTDAAVDNNVDQYNIGSFEAAVPGFTQFLFATGDCSSWLITSKDAIGGPFNNDYYGDSARYVCASSESPTEATTPRWNNRVGNVEDPWISTTDHIPAIAAGDIVYGEDNYVGYDGATTHSATVIAPRQGVYVYIRSKQLDEFGCKYNPCDECGVCDDCIDDVCVPIVCSDGLECSVERSFGASSPRFFAEYEDEVMIGLLLMNVVLMAALIVSCFVLSKGNKKYRVVSMKECGDEQALKQ